MKNLESTEKVSLFDLATPHFESGFKSYKEGKFDNSKEELSKALEKDPFDIGSMVILALMDPDLQPEQEFYTSEGHRAAFAAFMKSPHVRDMYRFGGNLLNYLSEKMGTETINLVDIGVGSAQQEVAMAEQIAETSSSIKKINLTGIEPSEAMIADAKQNLKNVDEIEVESTFVQAVGQDMSEDALSEIAEKSPDLVIANISIHHADIAEKKQIIQNIHKMNSKYFLLVDANSEHEEDLPAYSLELALNMRATYSYMLRSIHDWAVETYEDEDEIKDIMTGLTKFFFDEGRNIITRDYGDNPRDFHTTAKRWKELIEGENFKTVDPNTVTGMLDGIEADIEIEDDIIYMVILEGRKAFFSLLAERI